MSVVTLPGTVGVTVKDNGSTVATRPVINLHEGANVTLTVTDDAGNNEVDITIAASGGGGGGTGNAYYPGGWG